MLASEHILIDITLISCSPIFTNITQLWNIPSAFYLWSATVPGSSNTEYQHSRKPWTLAASASRRFITIFHFYLNSWKRNFRCWRPKISEDLEILVSQRILIQRAKRRAANNGFLLCWPLNISSSINRYSAAVPSDDLRISFGIYYQLSIFNQQQRRAAGTRNTSTAESRCTLAAIVEFFQFWISCKKKFQWTSRGCAFSFLVLICWL